ncbi:transposase [Escherichia coli]|uniref:transposase n=1 Tax=Escherichia coli TaxID=562 RepID=UPI001FDAAB6A|nr:transposase [Escherichia coli]
MALTRLASKVQNVLKDDPFSGHLFIFRGRRGDQIKVLWADSDDCASSPTPGAGPLRLAVTRDGKVHPTPAQLSMLLEGINWKHPKRTERAGIRI